MPKTFSDDAPTSWSTPAPTTPGATSGGFNTPASGASTFSAPATGGFNSTSSGFGSTPAPSGFASSPSIGAGSFGANPGGYAVQQSQPNNQPVDTSAFTSAIESSEGKPEENWMKSYWRPAMGWLYMLVCFCDFVLYPVLWSILQVVNHQPQVTQWNPITLQGAGLFHLAMGAVLGIAAYGRTKEKTTGTQ
jgi:hypothetical protein